MAVKYITPEGKKQLEEKLNYLKTVKRVEVVKKIGQAREFGDLSENSEYDAAKDEQAVVEGQIADIENTLLNAIVVKKSAIDTSKVGVGTTVKLYDEEFDEEVEYKIVGSDESDPKKGLISHESPVGSALMGHKEGEMVVARTPNGEVRYKILSIGV